MSKELMVTVKGRVDYIGDVQLTKTGAKSMIITLYSIVQGVPVLYNVKFWKEKIEQVRNYKIGAQVDLPCKVSVWNNDLEMSAV